MALARQHRDHRKVETEIAFDAAAKGDASIPPLDMAGESAREITVSGRWSEARRIVVRRMLESISNRSVSRSDASAHSCSRL
jgi:hypothetical protein